MEGGYESGQACLLTFGEILGTRMRELRSGSFIEIVVLDVNKPRKLILLNLEL
jgi:hypothetical protein